MPFLTPTNLHLMKLPSKLQDGNGIGKKKAIKLLLLSEEGIRGESALCYVLNVCALQEEEIRD